MTARRLVPASHVREWEQRLNDALSRALSAMEADVHRALRSSGRGLVAAGHPGNGKRAAGAAALAGTLVASAWSQAKWASLVGQHVEPAAQGISDEAYSDAQAALPPGSTWGMPPGGTAWAASISAAAIASGWAIGDRLNRDLSSAIDQDAARQALSDVFASAPSILDNVVGSMAEQAASQATVDTVSYLAGYFGNTYDAASKTWNATNDDRTREWHAEADGQAVGLTELFDVGGEALTGPGDPAGSDDNIIGCRCWCTVEGVLPEGFEDPNEGDG